MTNKQYFTKKEILQKIKLSILLNENLKLSEIVEHTFCKDKYIKNEKEAEKALSQFGIFKALKKIKIYFMDELNTNFSNYDKPIEVAGALALCLSDEIFSDLLNEIDFQDIDQMLDLKIIKQLILKIENLEDEKELG